MSTQYTCKNEERRRLVGATEDDQGNPITPKLNGIDYLEVASADQRTLKVYFLHNLPGQLNPIPPAAPALTETNINIDGGARIKNIKVDSVASADNVLRVVVNEAGDYSTYTLRLVTSLVSGFDPQLSEIDFSFKVDCPSDFDCQNTTACSPEQFVEPEIDYLAKDYSSFRRLILDRLSTLMPGWSEQNEADAEVALVEVLAYVGDYLSYYQDAVAAEAYLGTARRRISVRRHARLLDYNIHDGTNARSWVTFEVSKPSQADGKTLPAGTMVFSRGSSAVIAVKATDLGAALNEHPVVFETMHDLVLHGGNNPISFYTWSDTDCCLPQGATKATLVDDGVKLTIGDVLIFEEVFSPTTGSEADADTSHRCAVRLTAVAKLKDPLDDTLVLNVEWGQEDALPFPLCLTATVVDEHGTEQVKEISVAHGNVVLVDHGLTLTDQQLSPPDVPADGDYRPLLALTEITCRQPYVDEVARAAPAIDALIQDVRQALPIVSLNDGSADWTVRRDLLSSDRFAADFVVEMERDGTAQLRFGDGLSMGKKPDEGTEFAVAYRVGNGSAGNVGAESLIRVASNLNGFKQVRNPMPAQGGIDPETMEQVRQFAPQAFRTQERAVTEADWAAVAARHPEVQKAAANFRWTGSWYTVFITIDRQGGLPVKSDQAFLDDIVSFLEQFRIAGYDIEIEDPVLVPLDIALQICVKPDYFQSNVKQSLSNFFSRFDLPGGGRGFFHPDNFTFGQPVYLSRIYQTAMSVAGVASVEAVTFQRFGQLANNEIKNARLVPASLEIIQLDNDPNFPEHGRIDFDLQGGL